MHYITAKKAAELITEISGVHFTRKQIYPCCRTGKIKFKKDEWSMRVSRESAENFAINLRDSKNKMGGMGRPLGKKDSLKRSRLSKKAVKLILDIAIKNPMLSQYTASAELKKMKVNVSSTTVQRMWLKNNLGNRRLRLQKSEEI